MNILHIYILRALPGMNILHMCIYSNIYISHTGMRSNTKSTTPLRDYFARQLEYTLKQVLKPGTYFREFREKLLLHSIINPKFKI